MKFDISHNQTSYRVMIQRAVHNIIDNPVVMNDEYTMKLLESINNGMRSVKEAIDNDDYMSRTLRASLVVRNLFAIDLINKEKGDVKQVIILGGGLDTISFSISDENKELSFFEVDRGEDALKKKLILDKANTKKIKIINCNIVSNNLFKSLGVAGVDFSEPVGIIMLGVTMYLRRDDLYSLLKKIKNNCANGSYVVFDYYIPLNGIPEIYRKHLAARFLLLSEIGEPITFTTNTTDIMEKIKEFCFSKIENIGASELNNKYLQNSGIIKASGYFNIITSYV